MMDAIRSLASADLRSITIALRAGRLFPPFSATALLRYCHPEEAVPLSALLERLASEGMRTEHLAILLEAITAARSEEATAEEAVELVWTGPELPGTANRETAVVVRELFTSARNYVLIAGYAVYQGQDIFRALAVRMEQWPALRVRMFLDVQRPYHDTSADSEILLRFASRLRDREWPGKRLPEVFYDPRSLNTDPEKRSSLHAKCIVIDGLVSFVSSANFTEAAQLRNLEVGALIHSEHFARQLTQHFESLADGGLLVPLPGFDAG